MDSKFRFKFYRMMPLNKNIFSNCLIIVFTIILSFSSKAQLTLSNTYANIICNGATTEDTLLASGGSSPYLFKVNEGAFSTNDIYSLTAGTYTFTVQDALSASVTLIVTINQPSPVAANTLFTISLPFASSSVFSYDLTGIVSQQSNLPDMTGVDVYASTTGSGMLGARVQFVSTANLITRIRINFTYITQ